MASVQGLVEQGVWPVAAQMLADDRFSTFPTVPAGGTLTATAAHAEKVILLDTAAGSVVTLPAATGTGNVYRFRVSVSVTSNNHIVKVANATDVMRGFVLVSGGTATMFGTLAASDTITMSGSTTGGLINTEFTIRDYAAGFFTVSGVILGSGTAATVFSAAV